MEEEIIINGEKVNIKTNISNELKDDRILVKDLNDTIELTAEDIEKIKEAEDNYE